jgi:TatD DNase family protein
MRDTGQIDLIDTHCHLDFDAFDNDRSDVIHRAQQAGLVRIVNPGIDLDNCQVILKLCERHPEVFAAIGIHPNSALTWGQQNLGQLRELAQHPKVVSIGEIGLDFYRDRAPKDIQLRIFREQLDLAAELDLPVIIHSRQAEAEALQILTEWITRRPHSSTPPGVMHSYTGDEENARKAIDLNFYIGITGPVTFRNAVPLQRLVTALPANSFLVETDAPFLAPHPHRGKRNEPAYVRLVAEKIAELKNLPLEQVSKITTENAERLFHWNQV